MPGTNSTVSTSRGLSSYGGVRCPFKVDCIKLIIIIYCDTLQILGLHVDECVGRHIGQHYSHILAEMFANTWRKYWLMPGWLMHQRTLI